MIDWLEQPKLPSDWRETTVGEAYAFTRRPRNLRLDVYPTVPFVPMEMVPSQGTSRIRWLDKAPDELTSANYFERGDVLLSRITPSFENGKQGMADDLPLAFGFGSTELIPIQAKSNESDAHFLFYLLLHPTLRSEIAARMEGSTGRQRVPDSVIREWPIPLPPLSEQRKIAAVLRKVQEAVEAEGDLIRVTRELKHAALRQLFTRGLRGEPQKESEIGPIPESWEVVPLGRHLRAAQYGLSVRGQPAGTTPILRMNCQDDGKVLFRNLQFVDLDETTLSAFRLRSGDLLFNRTNSAELVGRTALFRSDKEAVFASYLIRLTLDEAAWVPEFVNYFMNSKNTQTEVKKLASRGVSQANISASKLKEFSIPKPHIAEQREIAAHQDAIDAKLAHHEARQKLLRELFRTLLRDLMTGRRRVTNLDLLK